MKTLHHKTDLLIASSGVLVTALSEAAVPKAAHSVHHFEERGQRNCVLLLLKTQEVKRYATYTTTKISKLPTNLLVLLSRKKVD